MWELDGIEYVICPKGIVDEVVKKDRWIPEVFRLYQHYKNNIMPCSGGLYDQTAVYLRFMEIIDRIVREHGER